MLTEEVKEYIKKSVLCWLATVNSEGQPNVSPKEMFLPYGENKIIIANIASPVSVNNILNNPSVSLSFIEVFVQKGFKIKGDARIVEKEDPAFPEMKARLVAAFSDIYPIQSIILVTIRKIDKLIAPSYFLFEDTTEEKQIKNALKIYGVDKKDENDSTE